MYTLAFALTLVSGNLVYKLKNLGSEPFSTKDAVFVITSKGSRVFDTLSSLKQFKLFAMTSSVSYVLQKVIPNEVQITAIEDETFILDSLSDFSSTSRGEN